VISQFATSFAVALLAAVAVQLGFGAAFVDDAVGYPVVVYVCALAAIAARSGVGLHPLLRAVVAAVAGGLTLWALRTKLQFEFPFGQFLTTGHWPFFALPAAALVGELTNAALFRALRARTTQAPKAPPTQGA
jgi:hypothetical protein